MQKNSILSSNKIVIKIGSSLLTNSRGGVNKTVLKNVVEDIVWDDFGMSGQRAYCYFVHPYPPDGKSNIIALLPPFYPNSAK